MTTEVAKDHDWTRKTAQESDNVRYH